MRFLRKIPGGAFVATVCVCGYLFAGAASASARTLNVNALAHIAYTGTISHELRFAGTVNDPALGNGALLASFGRSGSGYGGTATWVTPSGRLTATVRLVVHLEGQLVRIGLTADVTGATWRFRGARGTLTGSALVTATASVGFLRLRGTLHGASGLAPVPPSGAVVHHVDGHFIGAELSLSRSGVETVIGSASGLVPGPAVLVAYERATDTSARGPCTVFAAGGTLTGFINVRFPGGGKVRTETGTYSFTKGSGNLSGVHAASVTVRGRRDLELQQIDTHMKGELTL